MKKIILTLLMTMTITSIAFADVTITNPQGPSSGSSVNGVNSNSNVNSDQSQGNQQGVTFNQSSTGSDISRAVGTAVAPALTTTLTETCMGSTSVGAGWSGASLSFGTTWRDSACVRRLDARQVQSMGDVQAAKEVMCDSDLVRDAFKKVGRPCAEDGGNYAPVVKAEVAPAPMPAPATDAPVTDEQDMHAKSSQRILMKAEEARKAMKESHGF